MSLKQRKMKLKARIKLNQQHDHGLKFEVRLHSHDTG